MALHAMGENDMNRRRSVRITPLGYLVLSIIILVMLVGIYFLIWSMRGGNEAVDPGQISAGVSLMTPTPSLVPAVAETPSPAPTIAATLPAATTAAVTDTPKPDDTPTPAVKTPSPAQVQSAVDGTLTASGVRLRKGPGEQYDIIGTYTSGTQLKIYEIDGDFYFIKIVKENIYGYMAKRFIQKNGLLAGESATPTPAGIAGTIPGVVSASVVALRSMPSTEGNTPFGEIKKDAQVFIYFKTGDFYYVQVVESGTKGYAAAKFITASAAVPTGTPVP